ncbi:hypothetical protein SUGI_0377130 [Cryptomeria japonica]|uniref:putative leucine-rich repeat receptor-like serine/threonine-protein kinase At2g24130 n=1 Tax=Cryptomeria japonica TaxID=3369 RepID=UPI002408B1EB|nr:putative leucine-rich repeat receptor-like serine/threonine-protein kinase At2g24130 [Cryptomeria japonica]GLJ20704.1 hypothetical protein SUGI_0377130 [Cryptomeria japonica]
MSFALIALSSRWRRARHPHSNRNSPSLNVGNPRISYSELANSTGGLSEVNLVGTGAFGSIYRGTLKNGTNIAIKVFNLLDANAHESFHRECNILKKFRHRNVIKIISICSNLDFKALILPFMSNGSLERWLYPPEISGCRLNLHDRLRIIMEIAERMAYLHRHSTVQVIHGDLKPNNVLLGDDMTAYIADFGIAKMLSSKSWDHMTSTNALKGSIGYIAPEYGMDQEISTNGDVYSFGILLLELLIRRRPVDDMFTEEVNLQKWVSMHFPNKILEVVDVNIVNISSELETSMLLACLTALVQVGLDCTNQLPQQRPDMTEIIKRLHNVKCKYAGATRDY